MEEINGFDDHIRRSLEQLGDDLPGGDWALFEQKMSADASLSDADFDALIRGEMNGLDAGDDNTHWQEMAQKIEAEFPPPTMSDEVLDNLVTDHLQHLHIPYNATHWTLMSHRLEEEFSMRRKLIKYKIAEVSLMLLLLLTIAQYMPDYSNNHKATPQQAFNENQMAVNVHPRSMPEGQHSNAVFENTLLNTPSSPASEHIGAQHKVVDPLIPHATSTQTSAVQADEYAVSPMGSDADGYAETTFTITSPANMDLVVVAIPTDVVEAENITPASIQKDILSLENGMTALTDEPYPVNSTIQPIDKGMVFKIGALTELNVNQVITPSTSRYKDDGYEQYRPSYGGGITLGFEKEKIAFSTGLVYRRINYEPQKTINISGSFANGYQSHVFDAVNLNLLTIPVDAHYQLYKPSEKWRFYGITGVSLNLMALNHFNVTVNNLGAPVVAPAAPGPLTTEAGQSPQSLYEANEIAGEGLLEGGSFDRNHYFSANIGLGVERTLSRRWSLFVQPVYQRELFGKPLGPNSDFIHTFSVQVGAKSSFR